MASQLQNEFIRLQSAKSWGGRAKKGETPEQAKARQTKTIKTCHANIEKFKKEKTVCLFKAHRFPTGLLKVVRKCLKVSKTPWEEQDLRVRPEPERIVPWRNRPFPPRYYQKEQIKLCVTEGQGVVESAVGTGKTLVQGYVAKELAVTSLFIIPSGGLSVQVANELKQWFGPLLAGLVTTQMVRSGKKLPFFRVITTSALAALKKSGDLRKLVHDVHALFFDEIHHAAAKSYTQALEDFDHIYYRLGFTGTFLRNDSKLLSLWGFLSTVLHRYPARQAIADGFLTPMIHVTHELVGQKRMNYKKEYDENYGGTELLSEILSIVEGRAPEEKVLIIVKLKTKCGQIIHDFLKSRNQQPIFISGDDEKEQINLTIEDFNLGKIPVLIGSSVIGEGIDIQSAHHLLNCQGEKSAITVVQMVGRLVRLYEGKVVGYYHDFLFKTTKHLSKHFKIRREIVRENFDPEDFLTK